MHKLARCEHKSQPINKCPTNLFHTLPPSSITIPPPQPPWTPLPPLLPHRRIHAPTLPPRSLAPPLPARLDIPPTRTTAAHTQLNDEGEDRRAGRDPHEREHVDAERGADVELSGAGDGVLHDDEHDCCDYCGDLYETNVSQWMGFAERGLRVPTYGRHERCDEGEDYDREGGPAGVDGQRDDEDHDESEDGADEEEGEHPVRGDADEAEDVVDLGWEGNCLSKSARTAHPHENHSIVSERARTRRPGQQLTLNNLNRIEPIQRLRLRTLRHALPIIPLAKSPQRHGVKIMQAQRLRNTVDKHSIGHADGNDVGEVEADEEDFVQRGVHVRAADLDEDEEDEGDEQEEGGEEGEGQARAGCAFELRFAGVEVGGVVGEGGRGRAVFLAAEHGGCVSSGGARVGRWCSWRRGR